MGWTKHADAVSYYQKGLNASRERIARVLSMQRPKERNIRDLSLALLNHYTCSCVEPIDEQLCAEALDLILGSLEILTFGDSDAVPRDA